MNAFSWSNLSPTQALLLRIIANHSGAEHAIPVPEVARQADLPMRIAQEMVKDLVEVHGIPIGSSFSSTRPGWYICANEDERAMNRASLRYRALSILRRSRAFDPRRKPHLAELFQGQLPLDGGER